MAAGDVDVERRLDVDARLAPVADLGGMALGVRRRKPAAGIAGAGDQPGADLRGFDRKPDLLDRGDRKLDIVVGARPGSAGSARPSAGYRRRRDPARSWRARASDRRSPCRAAATTPIQFSPSCFCLCTPICAMRSNAGRGASASGGTRVKGWPSRSSTRARNFSCPMPSSTYFSRALLRLVRSPRSMKTRTMASDTLVASAGLTMMSPYLGEIPVAGDAAEPEAKPDAGLDAKTVLHLDRGKRDVVGVFQHRDLAGAVEGDVELARQPVSERSLRM